ncbi:MAG: sensor histidine kinase [Bacteroidia bacterium]
MSLKTPRVSTLLIHAVCWLLVMLIPTVSTYQVMKSTNQNPEFLFLAPIVTFTIILICIFYFNYYFLIPRLLFNGRRLTYVLSCVGVLVFVFSVPFIISNVFHFEPEFENPQMKTARPFAFTNLLLLFLMAFISSIGLATNNRLKQAEKEKLTAQLAYLQAQINPHFLFNTLNGIYAVSIATSPRAAEMVEKLSGMMRYSLNHTPQEMVDLNQEAEYIENYIELQKIRFGESVKLISDIETRGKHYQIAPMLLIPFVENAFKHGVNAEEDSYINIRLAVIDNVLQLDVFNNKVKLDLSTHEESGLGINNTKNRLQLIYPKKHSLMIKDTETEFAVTLQIQLA